MLLTTIETLDEKVVRLLLMKGRSAKELLHALETEHLYYTIQALYIVLRRLLDTEVIIKRGTAYFPNEEWRLRISTVVGGGPKKNELSEGESVTFVLSTLVHYDLQWKNAVLPLHASHPNEPIFFYSHHYIWPDLSESRRRSEIEYFNSFVARKSFAFSLVGSNSLRDLEIKKKFQNEYVQWAVGVEHFSKNDYITVLGDYIMTTRLTKQVATAIEECYKNYSNARGFEEQMRNVGVEKTRIRLVLERNQTKARGIRKRMSKDFFVPKKLVDEYRLY